jgi:hypothetical protein
LVSVVPWTELVALADQISKNKIKSHRLSN